MSDKPSIDSVFCSAIEVESPDERQAFVERACGQDTDLKQQVERLLHAHFHGRSILDTPARPVVTIDQPPPEQPGTTIGPYKLVEQIGEGGMGLVYMAEQQHPLRRMVALKVIKPGMDSQQVLARFEAEKQALAMMDHENIAKVFEAGTTETGHPFFVMELVRGIPIHEFCDQKRLTVRERLELFIPVCQAVQHAHQKGIIHRDLKPSNVLVTMHDVLAVPKVIDFGIAKALGASLTEHTLHTGFAQLVGTPLYMSPEQAEMNQLGVDTRSDVYSLGVLLYELLTGTTPFDKEALGGSGLEEMRRMIREDEPPRPSARVSTLQAQALSTSSQRRGGDPRRVSATLRGELDWIVMKSLEKDRSRRYESASAFASDIQRYLYDEPVLACPPTTMYKFHKFARKHRAALATAVAIAASLILGTTASAWQAVRATTAEAQANANEAQAKEAAEEATTQRNEAQRQRDEVQALNDKLAAKEQQLQRSLYASNMNLAQHAWDAGSIGRVDELLEQHRPKPGETDLRGFEWYYLYRLCHPELLTLKGHTGEVRSVAFSPDGKRLASSGARPNNQPTGPDEVKVWDAQTGQELLTLKGHTDGIPSVVFSPDGKRLASASWDHTVKVWDAQTGQELLTLKGHSDDVCDVGFSPDGKRLASSSGTWDATKKAYVAGEVKVWDAQTGRELLTFKGHTGLANGVAFSPDGKRLASGSSDHTVKVWDAQTGQEFLTLQGHTDQVTSVAYSPDGKRLASGSSDHTVKVWDAQTGQELLSYQGGGVAFSPDGKRLAGSIGRPRAAPGVVKVWDAQTGQELLTFKGHTTGVSSVVFSPDGTRLASGSRDDIRIWDATRSQEARTFSGHTGSVRSVNFSPDGKRLAGASWDPTKKEGGVKVWVAQTGQELLTLQGHAGQVFRVVFSPDGKRLASGSGTWDDTKNAYVAGEVKIWDAQIGRELLTFKGHTAAVVSVAFSPDSTRLASSSSHPNSIGSNSDRGGPGEVKVWDAQTGQELLTLKGHSRFVNSVAFSPDGMRLATLSRDNTVKVWNAQTGQEILTLKVRAFIAGSVAFSPDGKRLASSNGPPGGLPPFEVKVWDAQTGQELLTLKGHTVPVPSVVFSPDGKRLASGSGRPGGSAPGEVKVWDAQTGQELLTLKGAGHHDGVAFSPDGYRLASDVDSKVTIWDATPLPEEPQANDKAP